ncbi:hypothetical protein AMECASPLE_000284 [Ameca splendens]|uniref:Uncharacterized protein n=1 Tax=Ameca splendens TaxID=208324 RepID=A0ABV0XAY6_9TELE
MSTLWLYVCARQQMGAHYRDDGAVIWQATRYPSLPSLPQQTPNATQQGEDGLLGGRLHSPSKAHVLKLDFSGRIRSLFPLLHTLVPVRQVQAEVYLNLSGADDFSDVEKAFVFTPPILLSDLNHDDIGGVIAHH